MNSRLDETTINDLLKKKQIGGIEIINYSWVQAKIKPKTPVVNIAELKKTLAELCSNIGIYTRYACPDVKRFAQFPLLKDIKLDKAIMDAIRVNIQTASNSKYIQFEIDGYECRACNSWGGKPSHQITVILNKDVAEYLAKNIPPNCDFSVNSLNNFLEDQLTIDEFINRYVKDGFTKTYPDSEFGLLKKECIIGPEGKVSAFLACTYNNVELVKTIKSKTDKDKFVTTYKSRTLAEKLYCQVGDLGSMAYVQARKADMLLLVGKTNKAKKLVQKALQNLSEEKDSQLIKYLQGLKYN